MDEAKWTETVLHSLLFTSSTILSFSSSSGLSAQRSNRWDAHIMCMCCFVHGMATVIRGVTRLDIMTPSITSSSEEAMTKLSSLLAPACPALQQLQVNADVGRGLLANFGAACPNLSSLKVMTAPMGDSLRQLHCIMPRLTHCSCGYTELPKHSRFYTDSPETGPCCLALLSCASLTHMDFGPHSPTPEMWQALPLCLQGLHCAIPSSPPAGLVALKKLKLLEIYCKDKYGVGIGLLVSILRGAPEVQSLILSDLGWKQVDWGHNMEESHNHARIGVPCMQASIQDLVFLHTCVLAGLTVTSNSLRGGSFAGVSFALRSGVEGEGDHPEDNEEGLSACNTEDNISWFVAKLPPLPAFKGLELFYPSDSRNEPYSITHRVASIFPNLRSLRIHSSHIKDADLVPLRACQGLHHLLLYNARVSINSLQALCCHIASLKVLSLSSDTDCSLEEDVEELQNVFQKWGSQVEILWQ